MDNKKLAVFAVLGILIILGAQIALAQANNTTNKTTSNVPEKVRTIVCKFTNILYAIAAGIALLVVILAGIKWTASGDDPGARKSAKDSVIHAIIGLIIVIIAFTLVEWIVGGEANLRLPLTSCP